MNNLPNWWGHKDQNDNYYLRLKYAFNQDTWRAAFPDNLQDLANQYWIIAKTLFADLWINANTEEKAQGLLAYAVLQNKGLLKRLTEINNVSLNDWYSQDIMNNLTSHNDFSSDSESTNTNDSTSSNDGQNFNVNNDLVDSDSSVAEWNTSKNITDSSAIQATSNDTSTSTNNTKQTNDSTKTLESKTTQYKAADMVKLLGVATDPDAHAFGQIINAIAAPLQIDPETLHDWRGDF